LPKLKSSAKRARTSEKRRLRNKRVKTRMKTAIRQFEQMLQDGEPQEAGEALRNAVSCIDRAVAKGVLHRNKADRKKAQLHRRYNDFAEQQPEED